MYLQYNPHDLTQLLSFPPVNCKTEWRCMVNSSALTFLRVYINILLNDDSCLRSAHLRRGDGGSLPKSLFSQESVIIL